MLLSKFLTILPMSIFGFVVLSKFWLLLLIGFMAVKFGAFGCRNRCSRSKLRDTNPTPEQNSLYDEDDIVPDGQSGF